MAKYLKLFETSAEYQQFIGGSEFLIPNISLITDTNSLFYHPLAQEESELPYLTITALEDELTVSLSVNPCQYSLNGTDWNELQADEQTPAINTGKKIYFKAEGLTPNLKFGIGTFTISKRFNLSGTVMSMLFGDKAEGKTDLTGYNNAFSGLFSNTPVVNVSPNFLPANTLVEGCYGSMFYGCTSLVAAPELPATTLADYCYNVMFLGCTLLVTAPELPATKLADYCYGGMFGNCTSLVAVPELPATKLTNSCYITMFAGCTSLNNAPELPATTLADYCYGGMFGNCTSLVNAPELPATTLAERCYQSMFVDCTSLVNAPELPATTLTNSCYGSMFYGCTSLVNAPELPATVLVDYCYTSMFKGCTSLNYIKMLATVINAIGCLSSWVYNVSTTGTFVKSKDATWNVTGKNGIPEGWTVETA